MKKIIQDLMLSGSKGLKTAYYLVGSVGGLNKYKANSTVSPYVICEEPMNPKGISTIHYCGKLKDCIECYIPNKYVTR